MNIWWILLVPILFTIGVWIFFRKSVVWWELAIPLAASFLLITIFKLTTQSIMTHDIEYWGNYVSKAQYYEPYRIWEHETCYHRIPSGTDDDGNTTYTSIPYDCSHARDIGPEHFMVLNSGDREKISGTEYSSLHALFGNTNFVELNRTYYQKDGNLLEALYDGSEEKYVFVATKHSYKNKVQASTQHKFQKPTSEEILNYGLHEYPEIKDYSLPAIIGYEGYVHNSAIDKKYDWLNGKLGMSKEVRLWILLYKNKLPESGIKQEALWKGGNQNEVVVTIGVDNSEMIQWSQVISWSESEGLKSSIENHLNEMGKLDLMELSEFLYPKLEYGFERKDFETFQYLTVEPSALAKWITFIVTLLVNIAVSFWIVKNDYSSEEE